MRRAEAQHNQTLQSLGSKLEQATESFNRLDVSLNGGASSGTGLNAGGNVAVRIGERLEELDRQRQRAQDARFLIQCWLDVSEKGNLSLLEDMRRLGGKDGKVHCAHIARQLLKISTRLESEESKSANGSSMSNGVNGVGSQNGSGRRKHATREIIEKFLEELEKDLLKQFDDFYRKQDLDGMRVGTLTDIMDQEEVLMSPLGLCCSLARFQRGRKRHGTFR